MTPMRCPHCGRRIVLQCNLPQFTGGDEDDEEEEGEFDEMGFTTRQFTGGDED